MQPKFTFLKWRTILTSCVFFCVHNLTNAQETPATPLPDHGQGYQEIERFISVMEQVRSMHPDAEKLSYDRLVDFALEGMVGSLDRFSGYYHPESKFPEGEQGPPFVKSLGIELAKNSDGIVVTSVMPNSSAHEAGLEANDLIFKIDDQEIKNSELPDVLTRLQRAAGIVQKLTVVKKNDKSTKDLTITHRAIFTDAISRSELLEINGTKDTGYIALEEFSQTSHRELVKTLDELEDAGMKKLIFDLRGNPGGLLDQAVLIIGEFVAPNTEVVTVRGRDPKNNESLKTPPKQRRKRDYPLAVLIDGNSASASELVAGALQDLKRAKIIGEKSFGKGSVQKIDRVDGGSTLRITIAKYHTPSGNTPHGVGITPDIPCSVSEEDRLNSILFRHLKHLSPSQSETIKAYKDAIIQKAIDTLSNN